MDRGGRLDAVRDFPAKDRGGDAGGRPAGGRTLSARGPEHHGLVRPHAANGGERIVRARGALKHGLVAAVCVAVAWLCSSGSARALMADKGRRTQTAGIDLITYRTHVKQVVVILGALPAGDAMAGTQNIAVPTLTGMMLDRGTKRLDKFKISDELDSVGATISFGVGTQSLEVTAKCLSKDLPLVLG